MTPPDSVLVDQGDGPAQPGRLSLKCAARSDVGLVREGNEDSGLADDTLLIVADGMGGHAAGEVASASAVGVFGSVAWSSLVPSDIPARINACIARISEELSQAAFADSERSGLGTTVTALILRDQVATIGHVGDSAAFQWRDGQLTKLTHDHTFVQALIDGGTLTPEQARTHPRRSLLTRAVDGINDATADVSTHEVRAGDRLLLATDGLTGVVGFDEIAGYLASGEPGEAAETLIGAALINGAPDNVTVIVADVVPQPDDVPALPPTLVGAAAAADPLPVAVPRRRGFRVRGWLIGVVILGLLIAGAIGGGWWLTTQPCPDGVQSRPLPVLAGLSLPAQVADPLRSSAIGQTLLTCDRR